jgi:hypothetical protein
MTKCLIAHIISKWPLRISCRLKFTLRDLQNEKKYHKKPAMKRKNVKPKFTVGLRGGEGDRKEGEEEGERVSACEYMHSWPSSSMAACE